MAGERRVMRPMAPSESPTIADERRVMRPPAPSESPTIADEKRTPRPPTSSESPTIAAPPPGSPYDLTAQPGGSSGQSGLSPTENDRYLLKKFHARGGMGEIWISQDPHIGREVAFKRLRTTNVAAHERFISEAQVTGQLEHPYIVPVYDMGRDESGSPYYVMKFVRGTSLKHTIFEYHEHRKGTDPLPELQQARLLNVFVGICQALSYAHSRGVLHRDIKPDNIMLGDFGEIMLLDWGLAKVQGQKEHAPITEPLHVVSESGSMTEAGSILGSPLYMPPEMAEGFTLETDRRTDIYLLGATLYEMLTGRPPREGKTRDELLDLARTARPIAPRELSRIDKPLEAICLKAMSWRREDRYGNVDELLQDMQKYMVGEPVSAYPEPWTVKLMRWCKKHQSLLRRVAAVVVLSAVGLFVVVKWRQLEQRRQAAVLAAADLQKKEQARVQVADFDQKLDEARFFAASTDSVSERAPYFDPDKAQLAATAALDSAASWGPSLENLPLPAEAPRLRSRMYELLLLLAQQQTQRPEPAAAQKVKTLLDRADHLVSEPTRGYYQLRARSLQQQNDPAAAQQTALANNPQTPATAFDYFLSGEEWRTKSVNPEETGDGIPHAAAERLDNVQHAVENYKHALDLDPTLYWAHFQLGRSYLSLGKSSEAIETLGTCVALRPTAPWSYSARGIAEGLLGRYDEALADLNHALQLNPDFLPALLNRGAIRWLQSDTSSALADFDTVLSAPENRRLPEAAYYRAQIYLEKNDLDRALTDLNSVLAVEPNFTAAVLLRARVHLLKGDSKACLADMNQWLSAARGIEFTSKDPHALEIRGELLRGQAPDLPPPAMRAVIELARQDLEAARSLGNNSAKLLATHGALLDLIGDIPGAIADYTASLKADPQENHVQLARAWAYQKIADNTRSADDFRAVISRNPESAEAHVGLGYIFATTGQFDAAREEASHALLTGSSDYLILHNAACIYATLSDAEKTRTSESQQIAIAMLQKSLDLWKVTRKGPDERGLIQQESAFSPALRARPEFKRLLLGS